jgi:hypothetical protein
MNAQNLGTGADFVRHTHHPALLPVPVSVGGLIFPRSPAFPVAAFFRQVIGLVSSEGNDSGRFRARWKSGFRDRVCGAFWERLSFLAGDTHQDPAPREGYRLGERVDRTDQHAPRMGCGALGTPQGKYVLLIHAPIPGRSRKVFP